MELKNLRECGKIGVGTVFAPISALYEINIGQAKKVAQEALYKTLETVTPETLINAGNTLDAYIQQNSSVGDTFIIAGATVFGVSMITSGIYNLVKNYRTETKE